MIIFRPRISDKNEDRFLKGTLLTEKMCDKYLTWGDTNLQPFYEDPKINTSLKFLLNRSVMYVDVIIVILITIHQFLLKKKILIIYWLLGKAIIALKLLMKK